MKELILRISRSVKRKVVGFYALLAVMLIDAQTARAQGLGDLGGNITGNMPGIAKAIQVGGFLAGLVFVIMGLFEFYNIGKKPDATVGGGVKKCAIGAVLLGLGAIITAFSATIFGGDESGGGLGDLGL